MPIKWEKYTYRIACRRRVPNGPDFTCDQLVNGYVCGVDLHDSNRPWPIGIHKYGKRWILTDLISGMRVRDFTKRPTEVDLPGCMWLILKYWERRSKERGVLGPSLDQLAYESLCPFTPELRRVEPVMFCLTHYMYPEFDYIMLSKGWVVK